MPATAANTRQITEGKLLVGVSDLAVLDDSSSGLITYALGSCIGVTVYDPVAKVGGMLHFMLPQVPARIDPATVNPAMYGDVGIPLLFKSCYALGAVKERLVVCAAGGAEILDDDGCFRVGARNRTLVRKIFWQNSVLMAAEDTGGNSCRTLSIQLSDGKVGIKSQGKVRQLWPQ